MGRVVGLRMRSLGGGRGRRWLVLKRKGWGEEGVGVWRAWGMEGVVRELAGGLGAPVEVVGGSEGSRAGRRELMRAETGWRGREGKSGGLARIGWSLMQRSTLYSHPAAVESSSARTWGEISALLERRLESLRLCSTCTRGLLR